MKKGGLPRWKASLLAMLSAGMCFQGVQCNINSDELLPEFVSTVASLFITDWVNNLFGVSSNSFF